MSKVSKIAVLIINGKESHSVDTDNARQLDFIKQAARYYRDSYGHQVELVRRQASRWAGKDGFIAFAGYD